MEERVRKKRSENKHAKDKSYGHGNARKYSLEDSLAGFVTEDRDQIQSFPATVQSGVTESVLGCEAWWGLRISNAGCLHLKEEAVCSVYIYCIVTEYFIITLYIQLIVSETT